MQPNARPELLPEAGARHERTLEAVSSRPLFGWLRRLHGLQPVLLARAQAVYVAVQSIIPFSEVPRCLPAVPGKVWGIEKKALSKVSAYTVRHKPPTCLRLPKSRNVSLPLHQCVLES